MFKAAFWVFSGASALALYAYFGAAEAQTETTKETAPATQDGSVVVPRRSKAKAAAAAVRQASPKSAGAVDWQDVNEEVTKMRASEAQAQREVRAMELTRALTPAEREKMRPRGLRTASAKQFQRMSSQEIGETRVPVLAPVTADTMGSMRVAARENAFTVFGDLPDGAYFEIIGTRMRVVGGTAATMEMRAKSRSAALPRLASLDAPYEISRHEQGVDLSFSRFNVAYQISVLCQDPDGDARCAGDDFVMSLADNLAILNQEEGAGQ